MGNEATEQRGAAEEIRESHAQATMPRPIREQSDNEPLLKTMESCSGSTRTNAEVGRVRSKFTMIGIAILCGLAIWVIDAPLEYLIFHKGE